MLAGAAATAAALAGCRTLDGDAPSPGTDDDTEWPNHGADTAGTAYVEDAAAPRDGATERWAVQVPWVSDRPVVAAGLVFLPAATALVAYDVSSGEELWRYSPPEHDQPWFHSPAVADGLVYATFREDDGAVALDPTDGRVRWRADVGRVSAPPLPVGTGDARRVVVGQRSGRVSLLDGLGTVLWHEDLFGPVTTLHGETPSLGPTVYAGTEAGEVYCLYDSGDGPVGLWRRKIDGAVASMAVDGDVYASAWGGKLYRLRDGLHTGRSAWTTEEGGTSTGGLVLADDVYGKNLAGLSAVDPRTGDTAWTVHAGNEYDFTAAPAAAGDTLYVGREAEVVAYKLNGGIGVGGTRIEPTRWHHELGSAPTEGLAVADGAVFAATAGTDEANPRLHALDSA
jgi:outer membrane protein assembly factor BamB